MQAASSNSQHLDGVLKTTKYIVNKHGVVGLFRGVSAVATGAGMQ